MFYCTTEETSPIPPGPGQERLFRESRMASRSCSGDAESCEKAGGLRLKGRVFSLSALLGSSCPLAVRYGF